MISSAENWIGHDGGCLASFEEEEKVVVVVAVVDMIPDQF